jgi:porphyrinogen peroxidase
MQVLKSDPIVYVRTTFVGFCAEVRPLVAMLETMVGLDDGTRDGLTRYTRRLTAAYYFVPSTESLRRFSRPEE